MVNYDSFDVITEPRRSQSTPMFMRRTRSRRGKMIFLMSIVCTLVMVVVWRGSKKVLLTIIQVYILMIDQFNRSLIGRPFLDTEN